MLQAFQVADESMQASWTRPLRRGGLFRLLPGPRKGKGRPSSAPIRRFLEESSTGTEIGIRASSETELGAQLKLLRRAAREVGVELRFDGSEVRREQAEVCPPHVSCHRGVRREWWAYAVVYARNTHWKGTRSEIATAVAQVARRATAAAHRAQHMASAVLWFIADYAGVIGAPGRIDTFDVISRLFAA